MLETVSSDSICGSSNSLQQNELYNDITPSITMMQIPATDDARVGWQWRPGIWLGDVIKAMVVPNDTSASWIGAVDTQTLSIAEEDEGIYI
jgi:hypothetical protein